MLMITLRRLKTRLATILIACLILLALCWGVPRAYGFFASEEEEEFEEWKDPVRVDAGSDLESTVQWLNAFGRDEPMQEK